MPVKILMPALSPTMTEGNLVKWLKKEGDTVESGDVMAEIETDKATMEMEAVDEGVIGKIIVPEGTEGVKVNEVIAILLEEGEDTSSMEGMDLGAEESATPPPVEEAEPPVEAANDEEEIDVSTEALAKVEENVVEEVAAVASAAPEGDRVIATPVAKRMAQQNNIDLVLITGTGPKGRIVKADVEAAIEGGAPAAAAPTQTPRPVVVGEGVEGPFEKVPVSGMRKVIAERLTEAKQTIPHFYLTIDCEVDELLKLRKQINEQQQDIKISVNDIIIRACALALKKVPAANAAWAEDHIKQYKTSDVSVAVAIEGGLVTPVVRNGGQQGSVRDREGSERFD